MIEATNLVNFKPNRMWIGVFIVLLITLLWNGQRLLAQSTNGSICVLAYEDLNTNAARDPSEALLTDINVSLLTDDSILLANHVTDGREPYCFRDLPPRAYKIAFSSPLYKSSMPMTYNYTLTIGETVTKEFGANRISTDSASSSKRTFELPATRTVRAILSGVGAVLVMGLLAAIGMIVYGLFIHRKH